MEAQQAVKGPVQYVVQRQQLRLDRIIESKQIARIPTLLQCRQSFQVIRSIPRVNALVSMAVAHIGLQAIKSARLREKGPDIRREVVHDVVERRVIIRVAEEPKLSQRVSFLF